MLIQWLVLAHRNILGIKLNLNFSADADLVVLGRRNWPPTLEEYEAVSVAAENVALNPLNRTSTLRSCHGEILFLGYYAKNQTVIGKNSTLFIGTGTHQRASKGARAPASWVNCRVFLRCATFWREIRFVPSSSNFGRVLANFHIKLIHYH
jgi:hypothetical protein